ncbi:MAG: hypothetical protein KAG97_05315, partial [Victivallales bacterium]|nr:hypothetical protein [Victivallales bacterium]
PSSENRAMGPCFITFDPAVTQNILLNMRNAYRVSIKFDLEPDFKKFAFGFWESSRKYSISEFQKILNTQKSDFAIPHGNKD